MNNTKPTLESARAARGVPTVSGCKGCDTQLVCPIHDEALVVCPACESTLGTCTCESVEPLTVGEQVPLWDAINAYAESCSGKPSKHVYGNTRRMKAVVAVNRAVVGIIAGRLLNGG